jgi:hypothetical protein
MPQTLRIPVQIIELVLREHIGHLSDAPIFSSLAAICVISTDNWTLGTYCTLCIYTKMLESLVSICKFDFPQVVPRCFETKKMPFFFLHADIAARTSALPSGHCRCRLVQTEYQIFWGRHHCHHNTAAFATTNLTIGTAFSSQRVAGCYDGSVFSDFGFDSFRTFSSCISPDCPFRWCW